MDPTTAKMLGLGAHPPPVGEGDSLISEADLCTLLGANSRAIRGLARDGILKRHGRAMYRRNEAVRAYCDHLRERATRKASTDPEYRAERTRAVREQADKLALLNAAKRRELIPAVEIEAAWAGILRDVRAAMLALPSRLSQSLAHLTPHDLSVIDREIRDALKELAK